MSFHKTHKYNKGDNTWERKIKHHKWADEVEAEEKVKVAKKESKKRAKNEDHTKECPYCGHKPVQKLKHPDPASPDDDNQYEGQYECLECERVYRVNCPSTILVDGKDVIVQVSGQ